MMDHYLRVLHTTAGVDIALNQNRYAVYSGTI